ncbi:MAG: hypothetical protein AAF533_15065 [Acidobacteriota bacterium]
MARSLIGQLMPSRKRKHENDLFGVIDPAQDTHLEIWAQHGELEFTVSLELDAKTFHPDALEQMTTLLDELPALEAAAREALLTKKTRSASALTRYWRTCAESEDVDADEDEFAGDPPENLGPFLETCAFEHVGFWLKAGECRLSLELTRDPLSERLVADLDLDGKVTGLRVETEARAHPVGPDTGEPPLPRLPFEHEGYVHPIFGELDLRTEDSWQETIETEDHLLKVSLHADEDTFDPELLERMTSVLDDLYELEDVAQRALLRDHRETPEDAPWSLLKAHWHGHRDARDLETDELIYDEDERTKIERFVVRCFIHHVWFKMRNGAPSYALELMDASISDDRMLVGFDPDGTCNGFWRES